MDKITLRERSRFATVATWKANVLPATTGEYEMTKQIITCKTAFSLIQTSKSGAAYISMDVGTANIGDEICIAVITTEGLKEGRNGGYTKKSMMAKIEAGDFEIEVVGTITEFGKQYTECTDDGVEHTISRAYLKILTDLGEFTPIKCI
jgi:hypothetical protein